MKSFALILVIFIVSCSTEPNGENKQTTKNINKDKNIFYFNNGGGYLPSESPAFSFCDTYSSADAFIYGTIDSIEMTEIPFVTQDETRNYMIDLTREIDTCGAISPSMKINIKVDAFYSNYGTNRSDIISIFISLPDAMTMIPKPIMDINYEAGPRLSSPHVAWECSGDTSCGPVIGERVGVFAHQYNYEGYGDIWYLHNSFFFWSDELNYPEAEGRYMNIRQIKSLDEMILAIDNCKDYESEFTRGLRSTLQNEISIILGKFLPICYI
jgi:hypothetical protein